MINLQQHTSCFVRFSKHWACFYCLDSGLLPAAANLLPAVYLLDEIAGLAGSGGEVAQGMADATIRRLGHRSPVVKLKVGPPRTSCTLLLSMGRMSWLVSLLRLYSAGIYQHAVLGALLCFKFFVETAVLLCFHYQHALVGAAHLG